MQGMKAPYASREASDSTSALIQEMPAPLKRRFVGVAAVAGVIFLINFPSPTGVAVVLGLLVAGVVLTQFEGKSEKSNRAKNPSINEIRRIKLEKALQRAREQNPVSSSDDQANNIDTPASSDPSTRGHQADVTHKQPQSARVDTDHTQPRNAAQQSAAKEEDTPQAAPNGTSSQGQKGSELSAGTNRATPPAQDGVSNGAKTANGPAIPQQPGSIVPSTQSSGPALAGGAAVLARLRQQRAQSQQKASKSAEGEVIFAYASQTGTAQEIAKSLQAESAAKSIKSKVLSLNELGFEALVKMGSAVLVIIAASTGDGDSPDNAAKFYATLKRRTQEPGQLKNVKFTSLGLGDSNYTRFMGVSRAIRSRMQELGGQMFYQHAEADEVDGLESVVDPWSDGLWPALRKTLQNDAGSQDGNNAGLKPAEKQLDGVPALPACRIELRWVENASDTTGQGNNESDARAPEVDPEGLYSAERPYWAEVTHAQYLTATSSDRKVLHLEVSLKGSGISYLPGDSLGVMPKNEAALVEGIIKRLGLNADSTFDVRAKEGGQSLLPHLGCPCTVRQAFQSGVDLTSTPRKSLLRLLGEHCSNSADKERLLLLSSRGGREEYKAMMLPFPPSLLDLLQQFPSCKPPLAELLDALPQLMPRLYSISCSPLEHPDTAHIAFSVVRLGNPAPNSPDAARAQQTGSNGQASPGGSSSRWGVTTGWLERLVEPILSGVKNVSVSIPVHLKRGGSFGHPANLSHPMLMIGPGTGVAPFRGFLQHRRRLLEHHTGERGTTLLYFGCRKREEDYMYGQELEAFSEQGVLDRLDVAFSRAGDQKVYVQHRMLKQGKEVATLLAHPDVHIFVCGDGANMAKDVHKTLTEILETEGGFSAVGAASKLTEMTKAGQYIRDIWS